MRSQVKSSCKNGFECQNLFKNKCKYTHTDDQYYFAEVKWFLVSNFGKSQILSTVKKQINIPDTLIPFNKLILDNYPGLNFHVHSSSEQPELSEQCYYEVAYLNDIPSKQGLFFVKILAVRTTRELDGDIKAFLWRHEMIYNEPRLNSHKLQYGIVRSKYDGTLVIKSHMGRNEYFFQRDTDMNRAFVGCKVKFAEIEGTRHAKIISIEKNPFKESEDIYGYLEISPDVENQIKMQFLYYPLPENIDWNLVDTFLVKIKNSPTQFLNAWEDEYLTKDQFKELSAKQLALDQDSDLIAYITQLVFGNAQTPKKKEIIRRALLSLYNLNYQRVKMKQLNICFLKPFNTRLPTFICPYIQNHLETTPDIWRQYVKAKFVDWPANSDMPFATIKSNEGQIGNPDSDSRVILSMNSVKTDGFSKKAMKQQGEIVKQWNQNIDSATQILEEKVFSIDGDKVKTRDDAFSVRRLSKEDSGFEIGIHIADVTKLVKKNSEIFKEAEIRFHSTYIGKHFLRPMLPYGIQNILSLQQNKLRYSFSLYITLNKDGLIEKQNTRLVHNTIQIAKNFTYEQADAILADPSKESSCDAEIRESLLIMKSLAEKIAKMREELGLKIDLGDQEEQKTEKPSPAQMIIEQFMVLANEVVTDYVSRKLNILEKQIVEIRNNEKKLAKANSLSKPKTDKKQKTDKTDKAAGDSNPDAEIGPSDQNNGANSLDKPTVDSSMELEPNTTNQNKVESVEVSDEEVISDEETVPDIEDKGSDKSETEEESDSDFVNLTKIEENSAKSACRFLENLWKSIDKQKVFDLSSQKKYSESIKSMMDDSKIKQSIKVYLKYLLKVNIRNTNLVIRKKLDIHGKHKEISKGAKRDEDTILDAIQDDDDIFSDDPEIEMHEEESAESGSKSTKPVDKIAETTGEEEEKKIENSPEESRNEKKQSSLEGGKEEVTVTEKSNQASKNSYEEQKFSTKERKSQKIEEKKVPDGKITKEKTDLRVQDTEKLSKKERKSKKAKEKVLECKITKEKTDPRNQDTEQILKRYSKLKDTEKLKFTSPIRRFHDVMTHLLVQDLLDIELSISNLEKNVEEKLIEEKLKEEMAKENESKDKKDIGEEELSKNKKNKKNKKGKRKTKAKKPKSRYQIFQEFDKKLKTSLKSIKKSQKRIKTFLEDNSVSNERGMDIAKREIEIMEICKRTISACEVIVSSAVIVKLDRGRVFVFLIEFSQECPLNNQCFRNSGRWFAKLENGEKIEIKLFEDVEVNIKVKPGFPLAFDVTLCRALSKEVKSK